ncbi:MAG: MATE family efflux transporter [Bacteroidales bacterium]|nr:MATE family efflux transporter [Bacteroidales bacterium]
MNNGIPVELGTEKISKLLSKYAWPSIIAMTASSLYNMVDSIYIGQGVGTYAIAGLAITFPLMNLAAAFGSLVGVGAASVLSMLFGQKNYEMAQKVFGNVITLNFIVGLSYMTMVLCFLKPILYFFGASDATIQYAYDYMSVITLGNLVTHMYFGMNAVLRAIGKPRQAMNATIFTVILNTILDPVFIFGFGWGIRGAAVATVLSQFASMCWQFKFFMRKDIPIGFKKGIYKIVPRIVKEIMAIGASPFLMNMASCLIVIMINKGLYSTGGDLAIGAFGIINRISFIFAMIVIGLNQGMQPIAGFNFGAGEYRRLNKVMVTTISWATLVMTIGFLIAEICPYLVIRIFTKDIQLIKVAEKGIRIIMVSFPIVGFQMVTSNFFQSIGQAGKAIFLSLSRQMLFLFPLVIILPRIFGVNGVWMAMPLSDLAASVAAAILLVNSYKKFKKIGNAK